MAHDGNLVGVQPVRSRAVGSLRPTAVYQALLIQGGIDPARISTDGWGDEKPVASNDTEDGRAKNRRTELVVVSR